MIIIDNNIIYLGIEECRTSSKCRTVHKRKEEFLCDSVVTLLVLKVWRKQQLHILSFPRRKYLAEKEGRRTVVVVAVAVIVIVIAVVVDL